MYYQFNNITGRLTGSQNFQPYFPLSPSALEKKEPAKIIFSIRNQPMTQTSSGTLAPKNVPGTNISYGEIPQSIKVAQEIMQKNDGIPIFLKGGAKDKFLFGLTSALCVLGVAQVLFTVYKLSFPKKE